jgi:primosomal protein N' (replication factor Y)
MTDEIIRVALDTPLRRTFDYLRDADSPAGMAGQRVRVPFGRREKIGFIVSIENQSEIDNAKLKRISSYIDHQPTFDPALLTLLRWAADYYHHPLGEVIATALPKLLREGAPLQERSFVWAITTAGRRALEAGEAKRAPQQRALLERLARDEAGVPEDELADWPRWRDHARSLREREWAERREREHASALPPVQPDGLATGVPEPTPDQQAALDTIIASGDTGYRAWLLQGITGSGKTEVYLRLAERQLRAGRRVLILVPEIGLTPQLVGRFAKRFAGIPLAVLHSGLTDTQRLEAWRRSHDGSARLVLGTRSSMIWLGQRLV